MNSKVKNILIDADRNGVTIYVDDKVCYMSGNGIYICRDLYPNRIRDINNITVVKDQCGIYFIDYFKKWGLMSTKFIRKLHMYVYQDWM